MMAIFVFSGTDTVCASLIPSGLGGYEAGVIDQTNLMQIKEYETTKKIQREEEERGKEKIDIDKKRLEEMDKLPNKEVSFILRSISFKGNTVFSDEELLHMICDKIDTEVTINELIAYCNLITDYYQQKGYVSSIAYLPPQKILDGNVEVIVTEGKYGNITLEGNKWARNKFITKQYLDDKGIKSEEVLNITQIQETLRELNATDYIKGQVALEDNEESFEYTDLTLQTKDRFPLDLDFRFDDQGRNETGLLRAVFFAGMYNLTGFGDKLLSTTSLARHSVGQGIFYSIPIAKNETKLNLGYSYSGTNTGDNIYISGLPLEVNGKSHNFFVNLSRRFIKTENYKLYGDVALDFRNTDSNYKLAGTDITNLVSYANYKTRAVKLNLTNIKDDFYGKWYGNLGFSAGIPFLDASTNDGGNNDNPSAKYFKLNAHVSRLHVLPWRMLGILQATGQYATRGLYPSDQMQFGGISSVRGYQESFFLADSGVTASAEVRFPIPFLYKVLPEKLKFIDDSIRLAAFYDMGWLKESWSNAGDSYKSVIMSAGGGAVIKLTKYLSGNIYVGVPIGDKPDNTSNCRVHFMVTSNIL